MKRWRLWMVVVFVLAALAFIAPAAITIRGSEDTGQVYPLAEVLAGAQQHPSAWDGRTVRIRGYVDTIMTVVSPLLATTDGRPARPAFFMESSDGSAILVVRYGPEDPLLGLVRRIPLLGRLVPPAQSPARPSGPTVFRIRLHREPGACPKASDCVTGTLLDAAPPPAIQAFNYWYAVGTPSPASTPAHARQGKARNR